MAHRDLAVVRGPSLLLPDLEGPTLTRATERIKDRRLKEADFIGTRFGSLVAVRVVRRSRRRLGGVWLFHCDCGNDKRMAYKDAHRGIVKSCGCARKANATSYTYKDLTGQRFGRLVVLRLANSKGERKWYCKCDCDAETIARGKDLTSGDKRSCGCIRRPRWKYGVVRRN